MSVTDLLKPTLADADQRTIPVRNPRTGKVDFDLPVTSPAEIAAKTARLRENQRAWAAQPLEARLAVMQRWLGEVARRANDIAQADAEDTGGCHTSYLQGFITMGNIKGWIEDAADALDRASFHGPSRSMPQVEVRSQLVPYPLVGVISPWNAPMMLALLDAVPALFAGSAVLLKPSEVTPRFVRPLFESVAAVPELAGVFDFAMGDGEAGRALIDQVDLVCFTGSVPTGRRIAVHCAERLIPCFLELGGKDPAIVTATADLDRATTSVLRGAVHANGMVCFSVERIYVADPIHDAFVEMLVEKATKVRLNSDDPKAGHIHPFTFAPQAQIVERHLADAVAKGATILTGGKVEAINGGLYMRPTVLTGVTHEMLVMQEETFGPVMPVMRYSGTDEAIRLANDTIFGLTASVIAGSEEEALPIAAQVNAGAVFIQDTFLTFGKNRTIGTHSFGASGLGGSRTGPESILRFVRRKALMTQHGPVADIMDDYHLGKGAGIMANWRLTAEDRLEIQELYARYAWGIDLADTELALSTFTQDAWFDHLWQGKVQGHDAIRKNLESLWYDRQSWWYGRQHMMNHFIMDERGDGKVDCRCFFQILQFNVEYRNNFVFGIGTRQDVIRRDTDGKWRFEQLHVNAWTEMKDVPWQGEIVMKPKGGAPATADAKPA